MKLFEQYQLDIIETAIKQINSRGWSYLGMWMRTRKTMTSLGIVQKLGGSTIFVTKKKAIDSILNDIQMIGLDNIDVVNYESLHKVNKSYDNWILDEAHCFGAFPKPNKRAKQLKQLIKQNNKVIFLSGTPTPESVSQIFHQLWVLPKIPFGTQSFYQWAKENCNITQKKVAFNRIVNDYSDCRFDISKLEIISCTQSEAGFNAEIKEHFIKVQMNDKVKFVIDKLKKDKVVEGKNGVILADTKVKEMNKVHQLSSGTCILENGKTIILDYAKIDKIKEMFLGKKLAIFYKYKAELKLLQSLNITQSIDEFNSTNKNIALQFLSGREGINLSKADVLIFFNLDFSAVTYWQTRERLMSKDRANADVYFLFSDCGIERYVYKVINQKKQFTTAHYERI